eukprot:2320378-Rhodomonas_salina.2
MSIRRCYLPDKRSANQRMERRERQIATSTASPSTVTASQPATIRAFRLARPVSHSHALESAPTQFSFTLSEPATFAPVPSFCVSPRLIPASSPPHLKLSLSPVPIASHTRTQGPCTLTSLLALQGR